MKILAQQDNEAYLVATQDERGFVADFKRGLRYPEMMVDAILKFGYWENPKELSPEEDKNLLDRIKALPEQPAEE